MPAIVPPRLDDRTWQELRDELVRRIPVHAPDWTDHNPADPGIALLEVFAWLAENLLRRMDRVPDKAQLHFLNLLGVSPRAATVARALVRIDPPKDSVAPVVVEYSSAVPRLVVAAGKRQFSALGEVKALPLEARAVVKVPLTSATAVDTGDAARAKQLIEDHLQPDSEGEVSIRAYEPVTLAVTKGGQLGLTVELTDTLDRSLWIALLVPEPIARGTTAQIRAKALELRDAVLGSVVNVGFWPDETLAPAAWLECPDDDDGAVVWEASTGGHTNASQTLETLRWARLRVEQDDTRALLRTGVARVELPTAPGDLGVWNLESDGRPLDGIGDLPPAFDDDKTTARVVAWVRARQVDGPPRRVRFADVNVIPVEHAVTAGRELLGNGAARPGQAVKLSRAPVLPDSLRVEVKEQNVGWVQWTRVEDFARSLPDDPHFVLDAGVGEVRFGDGVHGRMPRIGEAIRAQSYRWGGGAEGNVPPGAISKVLAPADRADMRVTQLLPATGGADGETLEEARVNLPKTLRHNDRAVAAEDFSDLALATPGAGVGRAHTLPRHLPRGHVDGVPGVVSLVILPAWDPEHPDEPVPDRETLRKVCAWLEPRRLCTTELYLLPPTYVPVSVAVSVQVKDGHGIETVRRWVELAVRQHLAPLPPYGPAGEGWPFGRALRVADVMSAANAVEGVDIVTGVRLRGDAIDAAGQVRRVDVVDPCERGEIPMLAWQLPVVREVRVAVGDVPDAFEAPTPPPQGPVPWPVPAVKERC